MKEIVVHNWDELQKVVFDNVWQDNIMRYRSDIIYRGIGDASFGLLPKLNRICDHNLKLEDSIIRTFKKYGYSEIEGIDDFWQVVTFAQHHGLPTRLLDWSYSPLVAAHFATDEIERYDQDGVIYCLNYPKLTGQMPEVIREELKKQNTNLCSIDLLDKFAKNFDDLQKLSETPYALFFEPSSLHNRIVNQYALFSLVSDPVVSIEHIMEQYPEDIAWKIIIPKEVKLEIRDKLDYINISERMIYPGLDGICKWITRRYANLGPIYNKNHHQD